MTNEEIDKQVEEGIAKFEADLKEATFQDPDTNEQYTLNEEGIALVIKVARQFIQAQKDLRLLIGEVPDNESSLAFTRQMLGFYAQADMAAQHVVIASKKYRQPKLVLVP